jgi:peptide/nickel transport system substrate-binding protein
MQRRNFLKTAMAAAAAGLAAPRLARADQTRVLRFVPTSDLANLDPVWGTQYGVRDASLLVWDTLYGVDSKLTVQPQMCAGHDVSADGLVWTFRLRPGLRFHDNEPVLSRDVVASLTRWMARDAMGLMIAARLDALEAVDDSTFRFRLRAPFPKLLFALGKPNTRLACIMPERIARTDPAAQITEIVGSGPMRFRRDAWLAGAHAVFERFDGYQPRAEPGDWTAGGKRMCFDRIEWQTMPDPATAAAALQAGEIDWWQNTLPDLVPLLRRSRDVTVGVNDPLGNIGVFRMNHLHAPFNDVRARRAIQLALSQEDYMQAVAGDDAALWQALPGFFTPGTPNYSEAGGDVLKGPRSYDESKRLLQAAGYGGEPIVLLVATDQPAFKAMGDVTADLLGRIGMKVQYVATDTGTIVQRRASKAPPGQGGWHIFHTDHAGSDCTNPGTYGGLAASGDTAWWGWPKNDAITAEIAAWYTAPDAAAEKEICARINRDSMDFVTYIPTGFYRTQQAWRSNLHGVTAAPFPVFWGVQRT